MPKFIKSSIILFLFYFENKKKLFYIWPEGHFLFFSFKAVKALSRYRNKDVETSVLNELFINFI